MKKLTSIKGFLKFRTVTAMNLRKSVLVKKDFRHRGWWFWHHAHNDMILVEWDLLDEFCYWLNVDPKFVDNRTITWCTWNGAELYQDHI